MANENIMNSAQISTLYRMVAKAFAEDGAGAIQVDLQNFKRQVDTILRYMKIVELVTERGNKHWVLYNATPKVQRYAARGYVLIFKFREWLLNETLNYRYYYYDNEGTVRSSQMTENNIMNFIKFGKYGLQINPTQAKTASSASTLYNTVLNEYYQKYMQMGDNNKGPYLQSGSSYGFVLRSAIMKVYEKQNPGLRANSGKYQMFNRGHLLEALDTAISDIVTHDQKINDSNMEAYVFGKHLALDHIKASQGADNNFTKTSIKSGSADLYDYSTIRFQLETIQKILNGGIDRQTAEENIMNLFMHSSKYKSGEEFQETANKAVDKLLKAMQTQLKTINVSV